MNILKKILMLSVIPLCAGTTLASTVRDVLKEPVLEVMEVSNIVKFRDIRFKYIKNYKGNPNLITEVSLNFKDADYGAKGNYYSNDYYIIDGFKKISPLDLKVGDKIFVYYYESDDCYPPTWVVSYLYLCN